MCVDARAVFDALAASDVCDPKYPHFYIAQIKLIETKIWEGLAEDKLVTDPPLHDSYRSVLGAVAWTVFSRSDIAVYVKSLQGMGPAPRVLY